MVKQLVRHGRGIKIQVESDSTAYVLPHWAIKANGDNNVVIEDNTTNNKKIQPVWQVLSTHNFFEPSQLFMGCDINILPKAQKN